jgi:nucleotide-binding universal stress UspA family protein
VNNVLVPTDFSSTSPGLVRYAAQVGELFGASVGLLHVVPGDSFRQSLRCLGLIRSHEEAVIMGARRLEELTRAEIAPGLRGGTWLRVGDPVQEIITAAKTSGTDLLILSIQGGSGLRQPLSPDIAERVARRQPCLILTVRRELLPREGVFWPPLAFRNILVPVDFTESSRSTVKWAAELAGELRAKLTIRYAPGLVAEEPTAIPARQSPLHKTESRVSASQLAEWSHLGAFGYIEVDLLPEIEKPDAHVVGQMLRRAGADMIVTGSRRYSWWHNLVHDHAAGQIRRVAPCPVLSVPERDLEHYADRITVLKGPTCHS